MWGEVFPLRVSQHFFVFGELLGNSACRRGHKILITFTILTSCLCGKAPGRVIFGVELSHGPGLVEAKAHLLNRLRRKRTLTIKVLDYVPFIAVVRLIFTEIFALEAIVIRPHFGIIVVRCNAHKINSNYESAK